MSEQTGNNNWKQQINALFRAKGAGVSLVTIVMIGSF